MVEILVKIVITLLFLVLALTAQAVQAIDWDDCTHDGKYRKLTCYGIEHSLISFGIVGGTSALVGDTNANVLGAAALLTCGGFMLYEANGPGNLWGYPKGHPGSDWDRRLDWIAPCVTSGLTYFWRKDQPALVPWFTQDGGGIYYHREID